MKNLFAIESSIVIDATSTIRITGAYKLLGLQVNNASIETDEYLLVVSGDQLIVEKLSEDFAEFSFDKIEHIHISNRTGKDS